MYRYIYAGFPKGNTIVYKRSKISGLSSLLIEQGLKQRKGFSLIHFFNPVWKLQDWDAVHFIVN